MNITWKEIFNIPRKCTKDAKLLDFQFRLIHRVIYTKKELLKMKLIDTNICSFCETQPEDLFHVYFDCVHVNRLWDSISNFCNHNLQSKLAFTKNTIFFGTSSSCNTSNTFFNHIILIGKKYIHVSGIKNNPLSFEAFIKILKTIVNIEKYIAYKNNRNNIFYKKWEPILDRLT